MLQKMSINLNKKIIITCYLERNCLEIATFAGHPGRTAGHPASLFLLPKFVLSATLKNEFFFFN